MSRAESRGSSTVYVPVSRPRSRPKATKKIASSSPGFSGTRSSNEPSAWTVATWRISSPDRLMASSPAAGRTSTAQPLRSLEGTWWS